METVVHDIRYALRSLAKQRGFTAVAILCLALGIGANTAIFSVVHTVLIQSLPYRDAGQLVRVFEAGIFNGQKGLGSVSVPNYVDLRKEPGVFQSLAAYSSTSRDLQGNGPAVRITVVRATSELFTVLGASAIKGRVFAPGDDEEGRPGVAVISERFWQAAFARDSTILGKIIHLSGTPYTIVGVMPASFDFPISSFHVDAWTPLPFPAKDGATTSRGSHWLAVIARLKPGLDSVSANVRLQPLTQRLARDYHEEMQNRSIQVNPVTGTITGRIRPALEIMLGAVGLVLLIACANVANLLLARASGRRRELAIRTALGAERGRLIRQLLTESVMLALGGGMLGIALAWWGLRAILALAASSLPRTDEIHLDPIVLLFAIGVSVLTGLLFGIVPALRASQTELREDLTETAGRSSAGRRQHRTLNTLVAAEISLSLLLLIGAGLLMRGFIKLIETDVGFQTERLLTFHISAPAALTDSTRYTGFYGPLRERLMTIPGVRSVAMTQVLPIQSSGWNGNFTIVGYPQESDVSRRPFAEFRIISPDYFATLGIRIVRGREFTAADGAGSEPVIIVNDIFAKRYMPHDDPLTKQILPWTDKPARIVGIVSSIRQVSLDQEPRPEIYVAAPQAYTGANIYQVTFVLSTSAAPESIIPTIRKTVAAMAPDQPLFLVQTMDSIIADSLRSRKLMLTLLAVFAGLAVLLSAAGVYGVMSYGVAQRTREIGIRMALGASGPDVLRMIIGDAGKVAAIGVVVGLFAAFAATRIMQSMLYGVGPRDPGTFATVALIIGGTALLASVVPAARATKVDPVNAIKA